MLRYIVNAEKRLYPPNQSIAILGPDGVGKSTLIEYVKKTFEEALNIHEKDLKVFHFRPRVFPNLKELASFKKSSSEDFSLPYTARPSYHIVSFFRLLYYWLDYIIGYYIRVVPELRRNSIVIFDRYFYEFLADPTRSRIKLPYCVAKTFLKLTPKPKIVFFLNAPADVILERKKELSKEQIEKLLRNYKRLASEFDNFYVLDATKHPQTLAMEVLKKFLKDVGDNRS